jgi:hypothetical protein
LVAVIYADTDKTARPPRHVFRKFFAVVRKSAAWADRGGCSGPVTFFLSQQCAAAIPATGNWDVDKVVPGPSTAATIALPAFAAAERAFGRAGEGGGPAGLSAHGFQQFAARHRFVFKPA